MDKMATAFVIGLLIVGLQATGSAQQRPAPLEWRDCSKGTTEQRLDCLTREVAQIKRRLDGHDARAVPLRQD